MVSTADSIKKCKSVTAAAAGGGSLGIGGAVSVVSIGAQLDADSQNNLKGSSGGKSGDTASYADEKIKQDNVSSQLGNSGARRRRRPRCPVASAGWASKRT